MTAPVTVTPEAQANAALVIQQGLVKGGMPSEEATEMAALLISRVTSELAKGNLPGLPGFDESIPPEFGLDTGS